MMSEVPQEARMAWGNLLRKAGKLKYVNLHTSENVLSRQHGHLRMGTGKEKRSSCHVGGKKKATQVDSSLSHSLITISYLRECSNYWFDNCNITQLQSQTRLEAKQNRLFRPLLILQRKNLMCAYNPNPTKQLCPFFPKAERLPGLKSQQGRSWISSGPTSSWQETRTDL